MKICINHFLRSLALTAAVLAAGGMRTALHADSPGSGNSAALDNAVLVAGTSVAKAGKNWAYLVWQPGSEKLLVGKSLAVYRKTGDASSASPFQRESVITASWDTRMVAAALSRSVQVGQDLNILESALDENFRRVLLPGTATLPVKLLYCVQAAMQDEELEDNLKMLSRQHPGLGLVLRHAYIGEMPAAGKVTYEIREFDEAKLTDLGVIGRVTLTAGQAAPLPAPHAPFHVLPLVRSSGGRSRNEARQSHLTVDLRWGTPDPLRVRALLQFGYNIYRVDKAYAETNGLLPQPATSALLGHLVSAPDKVARVNRLPVLPDVELTDAEAQSVDERTTSFFSDDRDRFNGGMRFEDGQKFYYFVTARDVLGRDGDVSPGTLVTVCGWIPPFPPLEVRSEPSYTYDEQTKTGSQHFRLRWLPAEPGEGVASVAGYHIYRWQSIEQMQQYGSMAGPDGLFPAGSQPPPGTGHIGYVPHAAETKRYSYDDVNDPSSPKTPAHAGQSWIYTVRAVDTGVCGPNLSANSAPTVGALFDLSLTTAPTASMTVSHVQAVLNAKPISTTTVSSGNGASPAVHHVILRCTGSGTTFAECAEFYDTQRNFIALATFNGGIASVTTDVPSVLAGGGDKVWCRVRLRNGVTSDLHPSPALPAANNLNIHTVTWELSVSLLPVPVGPADDGVIHHSEAVDGSGSATGPTIDIDCGGSTSRYRLYRRVNEGPLSLISENSLAANVHQATITDATPPAHNARVCYYVQGDDGQGHYSPLRLVQCLETRAGSLPRPSLLPLTSTTLGNTPAMQVAWVCAPFAVERFEVWLVKENSNPPTDAGSQLSQNLRAQLPAYDPTHPPITPPFGAYETARVAALQAGGPPSDHFSVTIPIEANTRYLVAVRAVGPGGFADVLSPANATAAGEARPVGDFSEMRLHVWSAGTDPQSVVAQGDLAWPARPLAPILTQGGDIRAQFDRFVIQGQGQVQMGPRICIGKWGLSGHLVWEGVRMEGNSQVSFLEGHVNPATYVTPFYGSTEPTSSGVLGGRVGRVTPLPCTLYRRQVKSGKFPAVDGELVQVTPLMEEIAYEWRAADAEVPVPYTVIQDPWVVAEVPPTGPDFTGLLWLVDRHPVVKGARYEYYLVFYNPTTHEVRGVMPTNTVDIP